jgi:hypothetical protein
MWKGLFWGGSEAGVFSPGLGLLSAMVYRLVGEFVRGLQSLVIWGEEEETRLKRKL